MRRSSRPLASLVATGQVVRDDAAVAHVRQVEPAGGGEFISHALNVLVGVNDAGLFVQEGHNLMISDAILPGESGDDEERVVEAVAVAILRANGRSVDPDGHARDLIRGEVMAESHHARTLARAAIEAARPFLSVSREPSPTALPQHRHDCAVYLPHSEPCDCGAAEGAPPDPTEAQLARYGDALVSLMRFGERLMASDDEDERGIGCCIVEGARVVREPPTDLVKRPTDEEVERAKQVARERGWLTDSGWNWPSGPTVRVASESARDRYAAARAGYAAAVSEVVEACRRAPVVTRLTWGDVARYIERRFGSPPAGQEGEGR